MALKRLRYILTLMAFLAAAFAQPVAVVRAAGAKVTDRPLPSLATFAQTLTNGEKHALRGVYVPGILAHRVVQQPAGDPGFVSSDRDLLTQFQQAISDTEQENRFQNRIKDPSKRWKISQMDIESRDKWVDYSMAKDKMFSYTDPRQSPWYVVPADDKRRARLNCIDHFLSLIPYKDLTQKSFKLPPLRHDVAYVRPPITELTFVPEKY